jgi:hypothetical protein
MPRHATRCWRLCADNELLPVDGIVEKRRIVAVAEQQPAAESDHAAKSRGWYHLEQFLFELHGGPLRNGEPVRYGDKVCLRFVPNVEQVAASAFDLDFADEDSKSSSQVMVHLVAARAGMRDEREFLENFVLHHAQLNDGAQVFEGDPTLFRARRAGRDVGRFLALGENWDGKEQRLAALTDSPVPWTPLVFRAFRELGPQHLNWLRGGEVVHVALRHAMHEDAEGAGLFMLSRQSSQTTGVGFSQMKHHAASAWRVETLRNLMPQGDSTQSEAVQFASGGAVSIESRVVLRHFGSDDALKVLEGGEMVVARDAPSTLVFQPVINVASMAPANSGAAANASNGAAALNARGLVEVSLPLSVEHQGLRLICKGKGEARFGVTEREASPAVVQLTRVSMTQVLKQSRVFWFLHRLRVLLPRLGVAKEKLKALLDTRQLGYASHFELRDESEHPIAEIVDPEFQTLVNHTGLLRELARAAIRFQKKKQPELLSSCCKILKACVGFNAQNKAELVSMPVSEKKQTTFLKWLWDTVNKCDKSGPEPLELLIILHRYMPSVLAFVSKRHAKITRKLIQSVASSDSHANEWNSLSYELAFTLTHAGSGTTLVRRNQQLLEDAINSCLVSAMDEKEMGNEKGPRKSAVSEKKMGDEKAVATPEDLRNSALRKIGALRLQRALRTDISPRVNLDELEHVVSDPLTVGSVEKVQLAEEILALARSRMANRGGIEAIYTALPSWVAENAAGRTSMLKELLGIQHEGENAATRFIEKVLTSLCIGKRARENSLQLWSMMFEVACEFLSLEYLQREDVLTLWVEHAVDCLGETHLMMKGEGKQKLQHARLLDKVLGFLFRLCEWLSVLEFLYEFEGDGGGDRSIFAGPLVALRKALHVFLQYVHVPDPRPEGKGCPLTPDGLEQILAAKLGQVTIFRNKEDRCKEENQCKKEDQCKKEEKNGMPSQRSQGGRIPVVLRCDVRKVQIATLQLLSWFREPFQVLEDRLAHRLPSLGGDFGSRNVKEPIAKLLEAVKTAESDAPFPLAWLADSWLQARFQAHPKVFGNELKKVLEKFQDKVVRVVDEEESLSAALAIGRRVLSEGFNPLPVFLSLQRSLQAGSFGETLCSLFTFARFYSQDSKFEVDCKVFRLLSLLLHRSSHLIDTLPFSTVIEQAFLQLKPDVSNNKLDVQLSICSALAELLESARKFKIASTLLFGERLKTLLSLACDMADEKTAAVPDYLRVKKLAVLGCLFNVMTYVQQPERNRPPSERGQEEFGRVLLSNPTVAGLWERFMEELLKFLTRYAEPRPQLDSLQTWVPFSVANRVRSLVLACRSSHVSPLLYWGLRLAGVLTICVQRGDPGVSSFCRRLRWGTHLQSESMAKDLVDIMQELVNLDEGKEYDFDAVALILRHLVRFFHQVFLCDAQHDARSSNFNLLPNESVRRSVLHSLGRELFDLVLGLGECAKRLGKNAEANRDRLEALLDSVLLFSHDIIGPHSPIVVSIQQQLQSKEQLQRLFACWLDVFSDRKEAWLQVVQRWLIGLAQDWCLGYAPDKDAMWLLPATIDIPRRCKNARDLLYRLSEHLFNGDETSKPADDQKLASVKRNMRNLVDLFKQALGIGGSQTLKRTRRLVVAADGEQAQERDHNSLQSSSETALVLSDRGKSREPSANEMTALIFTGARSDGRQGRSPVEHPAHAGYAETEMSPMDDHKGEQSHRVALSQISSFRADVREVLADPWEPAKVRLGGLSRERELAVKVQTTKALVELRAVLDSDKVRDDLDNDKTRAVLGGNKVRDWLGMCFSLVAESSRAMEGETQRHAVHSHILDELAEEALSLANIGFASSESGRFKEAIRSLLADGEAFRGFETLAQRFSHFAGTLRMQLQHMSALRSSYTAKPRHLRILSQASRLIFLSCSGSTATDDDLRRLFRDVPNDAKIVPLDLMSCIMDTYVCLIDVLVPDIRNRFEKVWDDGCLLVIEMTRALQAFAATRREQEKLEMIVQLQGAVERLLDAVLKRQDGKRKMDTCRICIKPQAKDSNAERCTLSDACSNYHITCSECIEGNKGNTWPDLGRTDAPLVFCLECLPLTMEREVLELVFTLFTSGLRSSPRSLRQWIKHLVACSLIHSTFTSSNGAAPARPCSGSQRFLAERTLSPKTQCPTMRLRLSCGAYWKSCGQRPQRPRTVM